MPSHQHLPCENVAEIEGKTMIQKILPIAIYVAAVGVMICFLGFIISIVGGTKNEPSSDFAVSCHLVPVIDTSDVICLCSHDWRKKQYIYTPKQLCD